MTRPTVHVDAAALDSPLLPLATTRWCSPTAWGSGRVTHPCWRRRWPWPTSRWTCWARPAAALRRVGRRGRAGLSARGAGLPQSPAGRAAERRLRPHDRPAALLLRLPGAAVRTQLAPSDGRSPLAAKAVKEVEYHRDHAEHWTLRLGDGTEESHARMQRGRATRCGGSPGEMFPAGGGAGVQAGSTGAPSTGPRCTGVGRSGHPRPRSGHSDRARRPASTAHGRRARAGRGCTPSRSGGCSPRCSICTAATRGRHGDRGGAGRAGRAGGAQTARSGSVAGSVPDPELPVVTLAELGVLRGVRETEPGGPVEVELDPHVHRLPGHRGHGHRHRAGAARARRTGGHRPYGPRPALVDGRHQRRRPPQAGRVRHRAAARRHQHRPTAPSRSTLAVRCPHCGSTDTELLSRFSSTACKALRRCESCREPFDHFKEL